MSATTPSRAPHVVVVGGGLAGLAAAARLCESGCRVELFESRRVLGGRASSFRDPATEESVDHCQHVGMGCCTNLLDFCHRTGLAQYFRRDRALTFIGPDGRASRVEAARWLPAPLHLAPGFMRLGYLSWADRARIALAMWKLARACVTDDPRGPTVGAWLKANGQSPAAIDRFWSVILVSALGEDLDRASLAAARKVLVDGFLAVRDAYELHVPEVPLGDLYGEELVRWFADRGATLHVGTAVRQVDWKDRPVVTREDSSLMRPDFLVLAVPWSRIADVVAPALGERLPWLEAMRHAGSAPITGVHLWFDRPIMHLPHAVLVGRLSQWIFARGPTSSSTDPSEHYYQVVISASRQLAGRDRNEIIEQVRSELAAIWPEAARATLIRGRMVTEQQAVFSVRPGLERDRPSQRTGLAGLFVAGDWTATGWPSTMEGAVRSGYLAAEGILEALGRPALLLAPDLPRAWLARLLIRQ